ncbi:hypothetical protein QF038_002296 [Pseudarthrobacter sp. W1I19]|nr:hypothetical protein [Pseudarthrobacter sp. W1I19]
MKEGPANSDPAPLPPHVGNASDIAYGMLSLASVEAKYVTGEETR